MLLRIKTKSLEGSLPLHLNQATSNMAAKGLSLWLFKLLSVRLFCDAMDYTPQAPLSRDYPGKNTGVGCHFLLQENLPDPGIEPGSPALQANSLPTELWAKLFTLNYSAISKPRSWHWCTVCVHFFFKSQMWISVAITALKIQKCFVIRIFLTLPLYNSKCRLVYFSFQLLVFASKKTNSSLWRIHIQDFCLFLVDKPFYRYIMSLFVSDNFLWNWI